MAVESEPAVGEAPRPRRRAMPYIVIVTMALIGVVLSSFIAPDMSPIRAGVAGALLGGFGGYLSIMNHLMD